MRRPQEGQDDDLGNTVGSLGDIVDFVREHRGLQATSDSPRARLLGEYRGLRAAGLTDAQAQSALRNNPKRRTPQDAAEGRARLYSELEKRGGSEIDIPTLVRALVAQAQAEQRKMLSAPTESHGVVPLAAPLGYGQPVHVAARPNMLPPGVRQSRASGLHAAAIAYEGEMRG